MYTHLLFSEKKSANELTTPIKTTPSEHFLKRHLLTFFMFIFLFLNIFDAQAQDATENLNFCVGKQDSYSNTLFNPNPAILINVTSTALPGSSTFTTSAMPANSVSFSFTWTPAPADVGMHSVDITATNVGGGGTFVIRLNITVACDAAGPQMPAAPGPITIACDAAIPAAGTLTASINCGASSPVITAMDAAPVPGSCPNNRTINRTWTATDACNAVLTRTQVITINDLVDPVFPPAPGPITVSCAADVSPAAANTLTATNNCSEDAEVVTPTDVPSNQTCPNRFTITRTWSATDACGNNATTSQIITVDDQTGPLLVAPPTLNLVCAADIPPLASSTLVATNNCGEPNITVTPTDVTVSQTCVNKLTITRTWLTTDACGNIGTTSQSIVVDDNVKPTINASCDVTFRLNTDGNAAALTRTGNKVTGGSVCPKDATTTLSVGQVISATQAWSVGTIIIP